MKKQADKHRKEQPEYHVGDLVWLSTKNLRLEGPRKLQPRFIGPFPISKLITPLTVELTLPHDYKTHPVFHVSLLNPNPAVIRDPRPPPPLKIQGKLEFEVNRILDSKRIRGKLFYLIDWKGYGPDDQSWEPASYIHAPRLVHSFHMRYPNKPRLVGRPLGRGTVRDSSLACLVCGLWGNVASTLHPSLFINHTSIPWVSAPSTFGLVP